MKNEKREIAPVQKAKRVETTRPKHISMHIRTQGSCITLPRAADRRSGMRDASEAHRLARDWLDFWLVGLKARRSEVEGSRS